MPKRGGPNHRGQLHNVNVRKKKTKTLKPNSLTNSGSMPESNNNTFRNERNAVLSQDDVVLHSNPTSQQLLNSASSYAAHTPTDVKKPSTSSDRYLPSSHAIPEGKSSPSSSPSSSSSSNDKSSSSSSSSSTTPKKSRSKSEEPNIKEEFSSPAAHEFSDPAIISISESFDNL